jgi:hypothetical protein
VKYVRLLCLHLLCSRHIKANLEIHANQRYNDNRLCSDLVGKKGASTAFPLLPLVADENIPHRKNKNTEFRLAKM